MRRPPTWACTAFQVHTESTICDVCLANFRAQGSKTRHFDMPPRVRFEAGWLGVGASHWFDATDDVVFPSKDGRRVLAQAACGGICELTLTWAPQAGRECRKCVRALRKAGRI
jgi:hypothetical protein